MAGNGIDLVLIFGATGQSGKECFTACRAHGFKTLAFVRSRDKATRVLGAEAPVVVGDVANPESIEAALKGVSHIIIALGASSKEVGSCAEVVEYGGMKSILTAAKNVGSIKRIVYETSHGVEDPFWFFAGFLNYMAKDTLAWKLRSELLLRESGIPYVVVRPTGLKNKDGSIPPVLQQPSAGEWGMSMISREVVGEICARALFQAAECTSFSCREDKKAGKIGLSEYDWVGTFGRLQRDGPMRATFEDHIAGKMSFQNKWRVIKYAFRAGFVLSLALLASKLLQRRNALK